MEFLPIDKYGERVYAGFWRRLFSAVIDALIIFPVLVLLHLFQSASLSIAAVATVVSSVAIAFYTVYFHYRFGATLGKMAAGIRVTRPNGSAIDFKQALLRSSVDIAFAVVVLSAQLIAISRADAATYLGAGWMERATYLLPLMPAWFAAAHIASNIWYWSEFLVLLFNQRRRAIHDFIAGTVVIRSKFAEDILESETPIAPILPIA